MRSLLLFLAAGTASAADPSFVDVFTPEADGYKSIRIPTVVVTKKGTVLAFAEGRTANADQAENRLILKRSADNGSTWGKLAVIAGDGVQSMNNPCAVVERGSGRISLMFQSFPAGVSEYSKNIEPGHDGKNSQRNWIIASDDDGLTWSKPIDITQSTKRGNALTMASGPGIGIQLRHGKCAGRILIPFNERIGKIWNVYSVYSDDLGKTWAMGEIAPGGTAPDGKGGTVSLVNEVQFVELKDGSVRLNARKVGGEALRKTCSSKDGGATWADVKEVPELKDPTCNASIVRYSDPADGKPSLILYVGPQSTKRENGTVFSSTDEGATWPVKRVLWKGGFAYAVLTVLPDGRVGCLFEADGYKRIAFARFSMDWLRDTTGE